MAKKMMSTSFDEFLLRDFKAKCAENDAKMNDVLEVFMRAYVKDSDFTYNVLLSNDPPNRFKMIEEMYEESKTILEEMRVAKENLKAEVMQTKKNKPE